MTPNWPETTTGTHMTGKSELTKMHCTINDFPPEVLEVVLYQAIPPVTSSSQLDRQTPFILSRVCRLWREIALSTPTIWSQIDIFLGHTDSKFRYKQICATKILLERSTGAPLDVWLRGALQPGESYQLAPFFESSYRWRSLFFAVAPGCRNVGALNILRDNLDALASLDVASAPAQLTAFANLPALRRLNYMVDDADDLPIHCLNLRELSTTSMPQFCRILGMSPYLVRASVCASTKCRLGSYTIASESVRHLTLPADMLAYASLACDLPLLEKLEYESAEDSMYSDQTYPIDSALHEEGVERLAALTLQCTLRSLVISFAGKQTATRRSARFCSLLSGQLSHLTRLTLAETYHGRSNVMCITFLANKDVLPELMELDYRLRDDSDPDSDMVYDVVAGFVRRRKLIRFKMYLCGTRDEYPKRFLDTMQEMKREGLVLSMVGNTFGSFVDLRGRCLLGTRI